MRFRAGFFCLLIILLIGLNVKGQQPGWNISLAANTTARSTLTVANQCQRTHNFEIQPQNVPFFSLAQTRVQVNGRQTVVIPVVFNTQSLTLGLHQGQVAVICLTCNQEPTCTQDREVLPVIVNVTAAPNPQNPPANPTTPTQPQPTASPSTPSTQPTPGNSRVNTLYTDFLSGPCPEYEDPCAKLRAAATAAESAAAAAVTNSAEKEKTASDAERKAADAEAAAKKAGDLVKPEGVTTAVVDGEGYTEADSRYLDTLRQKNNDDLAAGRITTEQHQQRARSLTTAVARAERLAEQERLKAEADKAKAEADKARAAANTANAAADAARGAADAAKKAADAALAEYERCLKAQKERCLREQEAKAAAAAKAAADAAAAERAANAKRDAEEQERKNRAAALAEDEYLLDNIKKLGLIEYKPRSKKVPQALDFVFDLLQKLPNQTARDFAQSVADQIGGGPLPADTISALGELYNALGSFFDLKRSGGLKRAHDRLTGDDGNGGIIKPGTQPPRKYTSNEALEKIRKMEDYIRRMQAKIKAAQKAAQGK